jgi:hypothetical protein
MLQSARHGCSGGACLWGALRYCCQGVAAELSPVTPHEQLCQHKQLPAACETTACLYV